MKRFNLLDDCIKDMKTIAISGHIRPDGDCVGSCMAVYHYISKNYPNIAVEVFLEELPDNLSFLDPEKVIQHELKEHRFDLFIALDCGDPDRLGMFSALYESAYKKVCVDHHISNKGMGDYGKIEPESSSTCEVLYGLMIEEKIDADTAQALYTGIIHDTGVFQYTNTSPHTMRVAAALMERKFPFSGIIENSFYKKSYGQNKILGLALMESILLCNGKVIASTLDKKDMQLYGVGSKDLDGIVSQLRNTKGTNAAIFLYEIEPMCYKVSMRSDDAVDVSAIAVSYGGGGHKKAAGCTMNGTSREIIELLVSDIEKQLK